MSAIINSIIARKAGQGSSHVEAASVGGTSGHAEGAGGLRGHSVGDSYPWRVIGHPGGAWSVVGADNAVRERIGFSNLLRDPRWAPDELDDLACEEAHDLARRLKIDFPSGRV